ncbi:uncharacterized protein LOC108113723 [Drosophila eugracilis]|uniref:uncharacterized protein LOC108113723 n=1 Tax=Drosophila eugracilis TaxID=29029 RepID=UPI001BDB1428|nr:uncharacterized protein LOC108113723 [Drosophila eugracilis]
METDYQNYVESLSGVSSDEDDFSTVDSSDESSEEPTPTPIAAPRTRNLVQMLYDRERTGFFSGSSRAGQKQQLPYDRVPNRLKLYLKDVLASSLMEGHIFMGLTACGQYMLSHRVVCNDSSSLNHYSFNMGYKYTLYFWPFQPHKRLRHFFSRRLFDDHMVDNVKTVTMTQWKNTQHQILVVHGAPTEEGEDSYITYVKVPKLGCLECKKLNDDGPYSFYNAHCLNCHLTVHTKYSSTETDPRFEPKINLLCPERILIISNGFMHMLRIDMDTPAVTSGSNYLSQQQNLVLPSLQAQSPSFLLPRNLLASEEDRSSVAFTASGSETESVNEQSVVARIIADFSDIETDHAHRSSQPNNNHNINNNEASSGGNVNCSPKAYEKLIFTPHCTPTVVTGLNSMTLPDTTLPVSKPLANEASPPRRRNQRIVTKFRNGITTIDLQSPASSSSMTDKSNAYEFSEDNEKYEKISTFRKRRLAEKKYEFSEDNSENIIPFTKVRMAGRAFNASTASSSARSFHRFSPTAHFFHNSPCASPSSSPHPSQPAQTPPHLGFRSPPSSSMLMRSPSRNANTSQIFNQKSPPLSQATQQMLSYKPVGPLGALSPLQVSLAKRFEIGGSMSPNAGLSFLSPRRDEPRIVEMPVQGGVMPEKPVCTKKLRRRYVEEDDATSVITSEEDDCISPGYHTSLPMEVHGSCYSEMQMISQASYQRLRCSSVVITQHSFDLETFTYYVISLLCQKHQKIYNVFYDWAYEVISVCPLSQTIGCMLMAQFSARDQPLAICSHCTGRMECVFHNRQYECRILFTWNMESGQWHVLDYGELKEVHEQFSPLKRLGKARLTFAQAARKMGQEMANGLSQHLPDYTSNLRVLNSDIRKSKMYISDLDNMVEFHLKRTCHDTL